MTNPESTAAPAGRARRAPRFHTLRVAAVEPLCDDAAAVTFDVPPLLADEFAFAAGQTLTLRRDVDGADERRSYSICAPVGGAPRIGVRIVPGGVFSTWLVTALAPGDAVEVTGPTGTFTPDPSVAGHHVLVAAGSGITPMLSIAASVLAGNRASRVTLFYGNRRGGSVMFADELADLKDRFPERFEIAHVLSREPREAELLTGRLDPAKLSELIAALVDVEAADHWWLCGPHGMVTGARDVLRGLGVPGERVHQELFFADDIAPVTREDRTSAEDAGPTSTVTVILDGRATTADVPRSRTVLDSAQQARPDLPFACKGGVCGTCRARVVEGTAPMRRNFALEPAEVAAGYVLTCQAEPGSETVVVDFDA
ncbi:1,2-phenylacetyl-CoA epoxidase subunit PaaE [Yinghuangia seranimata]|uniref:1,2-phenylacetyl-CoA epoxidase subunit PaaE n=1 Tax=Yinghuangia seranimata TaxID=408067 RepID=UPI00248CE013|nr:1,2-phenylacetyl-CoA epoxidase subunit PaaE [Yinghuangia seranimata]MDI2124810.1 phenylacetate-CoA oxygenase/reductase subunit PaaK [Yinghuangia seranimata]